MMDQNIINVLLNIVTVLITGGMLGVVLRYRQGMRKLALDDDADRREHNNQANADIRDHYAEELGRVIERQRACEEREEALRRRVAELENDILGLINIIRQASADKVLILDSGASEIIRDMAQRIKDQRSL